MSWMLTTIWILIPEYIGLEDVECLALLDEHDELVSEIFDDEIGGDVKIVMGDEAENLNYNFWEVYCISLIFRM